jgi:hypothetical protein
LLPFSRGGERTTGIGIPRGGSYLFFWRARALPGQREELLMNAHVNMNDVFERRTTFPDFEPQARLSRLVGLDDHKARLTKVLGLLVNPTGLDDGRISTTPTQRTC